VKSLFAGWFMRFVVAEGATIWAGVGVRFHVVNTQFVSGVALLFRLVKKATFVTGNAFPSIPVCHFEKST